MGKKGCHTPEVETQLDHVWPISILLCDRWWVSDDSDVCCHFHQTGGKVSQFNWFLFIDLLYGKERKPRWNILDWICFFFLMELDVNFPKIFGPPDLWKTLVHFFRWLKSKDGWSCKTRCAFALAGLDWLRHHVGTRETDGTVVQWREGSSTEHVIILVVIPIYNDIYI